jgi:hypothetical protein
VAAYRPEAVTAECADGTAVEALRYNPQYPDRAGANPEYAIKPRLVSRRMGHLRSTCDRPMRSRRLRVPRQGTRQLDPAPLQVRHRRFRILGNQVCINS